MIKMVHEIDANYPIKSRVLSVWSLLQESLKDVLNILSTHNILNRSKNKPTRWVY